MHAAHLGPACLPAHVEYEVGYLGEVIAKLV